MGTGVSQPGIPPRPVPSHLCLQTPLGVGLDLTQEAHSLRPQAESTPLPTSLSKASISPHQVVPSGPGPWHTASPCQMSPFRTSG